MDNVEFLIRPRFDVSDLDRGLARLKELEAKGFTIPVRFTANLQALRDETAATITQLRNQWNALSADMAGGTNMLARELDRLGEKNFAQRIRNGFRSATEELLVLSNALDTLAAKNLPGSEMARSLAAARVQDLTARGVGAADKASFAAYSAEVDKAAGAQTKFTEAEKAGAAMAAQSRAALAGQEAVLQSKGAAFEKARAAAEQFTKREAEQAEQVKKTAAAAKQAASEHSALIRTRYENGRLVDQTYAKGPGSIETIGGGDTRGTVDRLKQAKQAMADVLDATRLQVDANKAAGGSAASLNAIYQTQAAELRKLAATYSDLERTRQTSFARAATRLEGAGANAVVREQADILREQQKAADALQRQRSAALIRQQREEERLAATSGLRGFVGKAAMAGTFIGAYGVINESVQALKAGAQASVEFESKLSTLNVIFRGTKEEARELALATLDIAASFGQDGIAALDVATDFARFGWSATEVLEAVRVASMAANVAMIDLAESSKNLQAITAGFDLNAGQLSGVLAGLNQIANTSAVTVKSLLDSLARVGAIAQQSGLSIAETSGMVGAISARTGRPGAESGNALKALLTRLENPQVRGALEGAGIGLTDDNGDLKSKTQLINDLFVATQRLSAAEREQLVIRVAGTYQASRISALLDGYIDAQAQAVAFARESMSAERENAERRNTLLSQLGTLRTRFQEVAVAAVGAGRAGGLQAMLTDQVKGFSSVLQIVTALTNAYAKLSTAQRNAVTKVLGERVGGGLTDVKDMLVGGPLATIAYGMERVEKAGFGDFFKSDAEQARDALLKFNQEVDRLQNLGNAGRIAADTFRTIAQVIEAATPENQTAMIKSAASIAEPKDARRRADLTEELSALAAAGNYRALNVRLTEMGRTAQEGSVRAIGRANALLEQQLATQEALLAKLQDEKKRTYGGADPAGLDEQIAVAKEAIERIRNGLRSGNRQLVEEIENEVKEAAEALKQIQKDAAELGKTLGERPKTTRVADLDMEADILRLTTRLAIEKIQQQRASGLMTAVAAKEAVDALEKERDATLAALQARRQYASVIDTQEKASRSIKDQTDAFGDVTKALPTVSRADELGNERQLLDIRDQMLRLERDREEQMMRGLGMREDEIALVLGNIDAQRQLLQVERERLAQQERFAAMQDAVKAGIRDTRAANEYFGGIGENETERRGNLIRGLTDPRAVRDTLTGIPMNIAAARADLNSATDPVEQARALARLKEMAIALQGAENELVRRRFQIEAEITNERRRQAREASNNLLMADRETQLRAALAAKFASERGGGGFSADEFMFLDPRTKQTIQQTNPDLLPPEFQTRLRELQDEAALLAATFRPLRDEATAAAQAIAKLRLPDPAINGGNITTPVTIDTQRVSDAVVASGHAVQTAIDAMGATMVAQLNAIAAGVAAVTADLATQVARLRLGNPTAQIGQAQGAGVVF